MPADVRGCALLVDRDRGATMRLLTLVGARLPEYHGPICLGYQDCCVCESCMARSVQASEVGYDPSGRLNPPVQPVQPWELAA